MTTTVVNKYKEDFDVYIGRGSPFGNPHPIGWCALCKQSHDRTSCIQAYRRDFARAIYDRNWRKMLEPLRDKKLGCYCAPQACHGQVIAEWLDKTGEYAPTKEVWTLCSRPHRDETHELD